MKLTGFTNPEQTQHIYSTYRQCLEIMGINCTLGCDAPEQLQHIKSGEHFFAEMNLKPNLPDNPVIFDVGANDGRYSEFILSIFPKASLYGFEPHPKNYKRLTSKVWNDKVFFYQNAISEEDGDAVLYERKDYPEGSEMASLHKNVITDFHGVESDTYVIEKITLDKFTEIHNISCIDFLKIDVEGHELSVIKGAKKLIEENRLKIIQFEFNHPNIESRVFMRDFRRELKGFQFFRLLENGILPVIDHVIFQEIFGYQNIVAIKA